MRWAEHAGLLLVYKDSHSFTLCSAVHSINLWSFLTAPLIHTELEHPLPSLPMAHTTGCHSTF